MGTLLLPPRDCLVPPQHRRHSHRHPPSMTHPAVNVPHRNHLHPLCSNSPDSQPAGLHAGSSPFQYLHHGHSSSYQFLEERENGCVPAKRRRRHTPRGVSVTAAKRGLTILQRTTMTDALSEEVSVTAAKQELIILRRSTMTDALSGNGESGFPLSNRPSQKQRMGFGNVNNEKFVNGTQTKKTIDRTRAPHVRAASANKVGSPGFLRRTCTEPHIERGLLEGAGMARLAHRSELCLDSSLRQHAKAARERGEKWAGPAYFNSPPPNSLPLPKFSQRQSRNVPSCVKDSSLEVKWDSAMATWELRRMLNLEVSS